MISGTSGAGIYEQQSASLKMMTSSGDKINLDLSNTEELLYARNENGSAFSFTQLRELSFSYEGNGLSEQDLAEIDEAFARFGEQIESFFAPTEEGEPSQGLSSLVQRMDEILPRPENQEGKEQIKDSLAALFDSLFDNIVEARAVTPDQFIPPQDDAPALKNPEALAALPEVAGENEETTDTITELVEEQIQALRENTFNDMREVLEQLFSEIDKRGQIPFYA